MKETNRGGAEIAEVNAEKSRNSFSHLRVFLGDLRASAVRSIPISK